MEKTNIARNNNLRGNNNSERNNLGTLVLDVVVSGSKRISNLYAECGNCGARIPKVPEHEYNGQFCCDDYCARGWDGSDI